MGARSDISALLLRAAQSAPSLDRDQQRDLVVRFRAGEQAALGLLIVSNVRLAIRQADRLQGYGVPAEDLVQEGIIGLIEAASRFDPDREIPFGAYARFWIKSMTMDFVLRNWSMVRGSLSHAQKRLFFNVRKLRARLMQDASLDAATIRSSVAAALGVPVREVDLIEARLSGDVQLNAPAPWAEEGDAEIGDNLTANSPLDDFGADGVDDDDRERALRQALDGLDDRERLVVQERWLTDDIAPLEALGEYLGMSARSVKRIELAAITKMQATMLQQHASALRAGHGFDMLAAA